MQRILFWFFRAPVIDVKVHVYSDSVLCSGKIGNNPVESWEKQIEWRSETNYFCELNRIDGKPMEFQREIFPGLTTASKGWTRIVCERPSIGCRICSMRGKFWCSAPISGVTTSSAQCHPVSRVRTLKATTQAAWRQRAFSWVVKLEMRRRSMWHRGS